MKNTYMFTALIAGAITAITPSAAAAAAEFAIHNGASPSATSVGAATRRRVDWVAPHVT